MNNPGPTLNPQMGSSDLASSNQLRDLGLRGGHVPPWPHSSARLLGPESTFLPQHLLPTELPENWAQW